jgi:hypothetical protein
MRISSRERRVLLAGGLAAAAILAFLYVIEPLYTAQASVRDELDAQRRILSRQPVLAADRERYQRRVEALQARLQEDEGLLFPAEKLSVVAAEIQGLLHTLAQETGVTIVRQNVPAPKKVEMFTQATVEVSLRGEVRAIRDFLYRIQTAGKLLSVPRAAIRGVTSRTQPTVSADITVSGYTFTGEDKAPATSPARKGAARGGEKG